MAETRTLVGRREMLAGSAMGAAGALAVLGGLGQPIVAKADEGSGLVGSWWLTIFSNVTRQQLHGVNAFIAGGIVIGETANSNTTYMGSWSSDNKSFKATFFQFAVDAQGNPQGWARIDITGSQSGNTIKGVYKVFFFDNSGTNQGEVDHGSFTGTRIPA